MSFVNGNIGEISDDLVIDFRADDMSCDINTPLQQATLHVEFNFTGDTTSLSAFNSI